MSQSLDRGGWRGVQPLTLLAFFLRGFWAGRAPASPCGASAGSFVWTPGERFVGDTGGAATGDNGFMLAFGSLDSGEATQAVGNDDGSCLKVLLCPCGDLVLAKAFDLAY